MNQNKTKILVLYLTFYNMRISDNYGSLLRLMKNLLENWNLFIVFRKYIHLTFSKANLNPFSIVLLTYP